MTELHPHLHCHECGFPIDMSDFITVSAMGWTTDFVEGLVIPKQCQNCRYLYHVIRVLEVIRLKRVPDCCKRPRLRRRQVHHFKDGHPDGSSHLESYCINCKETHRVGGGDTT